MAYQSLYRRYRPQKFEEIRGQEHVVKALRNAVRDERVGHAYLLSGPRGTGKTTAARILAKVLNCENPVDGEPDGTCDSCRSIESGTSFDLHELDAASNNKVDDIRDLLSKVALGTPGRTKVYLLDEVHMLTAGAENALLKTLEEPPEHVVFVLATTEPHKVVETIRSRTQQLRLSLIPAEQMVELVREVATDAGLDIDDEIIGHVVKVGGGSARDTLSALDQTVAAGGIADVDSSTADLLGALARNDAGEALRAIESATNVGVDPRRIGERFIDALRSVFLVKMGAPPLRLSEPERALADEFAPQLSPATITRSLETVGKSLVDMRQAPDPRIDLEVAFVRITQPSTGGDVAALTARIEALEQGLAHGGAGASAPSPAAATEQATDESPASPPRKSRPADAARAALKPRDGEAAPTRSAVVDAPAPPSTRDAPQPKPAADPGGDEPPEPVASERRDPGAGPTLDEVRARWSELLEAQPTRTRNRFRAGSVTAVDGDTLTIAFQNDAMKKRSEAFVADMQQALDGAFDRSLRIDLRTEAAAGSPASSATEDTTTSTVAADDEVDLHDLTDADVGNDTVVERITDTFPGAEIVSPTDN